MEQGSPAEANRPSAGYMEPNGSLPCVQMPATGPHPETLQACPCPPALLSPRNNHFNTLH